MHLSYLYMPFDVHSDDHLTLMCRNVVINPTPHFLWNFPPSLIPLCRIFGRNTTSTTQTHISIGRALCIGILSHGLCIRRSVISYSTPLPRICTSLILFRYDKRVNARFVYGQSINNQCSRLLMVSFWWQQLCGGRSTRAVIPRSRYQPHPGGIAGSV
jgi:hypothetical protein